VVNPDPALSAQSCRSAHWDQILKDLRLMSERSEFSILAINQLFRGR
jgi:hypothetical protein